MNENIKIQFKDGKKYLLEDLNIRTDIRGERIWFTIPKGFETDFASVPRFLWFFIAPDDKDILVASIAHDWVYYKKGKLKEAQFTRLEADLILKEKMKSFGAGIIKRNLVFLAVRLGGFFNWHFFQKKSII